MQKPTNEIQIQGVGKTNTTGKWRMSCELFRNESRIVVPGSLDSPEIDNDSKQPLLLSLAIQPAMGMKKSVRDGTIEMEDFNGEHITDEDHLEAPEEKKRILTFNTGGP